MSAAAPEAPGPAAWKRQGEGQGKGRRAWGWPAAAALALLWWIPINQLRVEWSINPQYAYGWAVPILVIYLFAERWKTRPEPEAGFASGGLAALAAVLALSLLPARLVEEAAPDWRMVSWVLAGAVVGLTLLAVAFAGGRRWLRHFLFPVCFFFVAVPWPMPLEHALVQRLMRGVASMCVEALGWSGIPAIQEGNVIRIGSGVVGVEEACSGVRSLQTTLMIALFLGELFRFSTWRRLVLLGAGLALAFGCNVGRALTLTYLYAYQGHEGLERYHDKVGLGVLALSLAGLGLLAYALRGGGVVRGTGAAPAAESLSGGRIIPRGAFFLLLGWLALVELGTEGWYWMHDPKSGKAVAWTVEFPVQEPEYHSLKIPEVTEALLRYNDGRAARWMDGEGNEWSMFFLRWFPGRASVQLARSHGPEICLPASGMSMRSDLGVERWTIRDIDLDAHSYVFQAHDRPFYVFYCLAEDRDPGEGPASTRRRMTSTSRLEGVWTGRRNRGQQVLEISLTGPASTAEAHEAMRRMLNAILRTSAGGHTPE